VADPYAGLTGAIVVGRKGELKEDLTAKDVDRWAQSALLVVELDVCLKCWCLEGKDELTAKAVDGWFVENASAMG